MAEPRTATPAGVAATKADVVLATKLHVPRAQPGLVSRPRLADLLEGALAGGLVLVCAPAGFGKTALLSDWARRGGRVVAWLSLDAADSDPARFWRHVVAALDRARPEAAAASVSQALAALGEGEWVLHSISLWMLALAERLRGRLADAERGFAASVAGWRAADEHPLAAWACHDLGRVQRAQGRLDATLATYRQVLEIAAPPGRAAMPAAGIG